MYGITPKSVYEPLTKGEVQDIHFATLKILEKVGISVLQKQALELYNNVGAEVDFKRKRVRIPQNLVEESLKKTPHSITLFGRNRKFDVILENNRVNFTVGAEAPLVIDLYTGEKRPATIQDACNLARIVDALSYATNIPLVTPQDVPQKSYIQYAVEALLNNTEKPISFVCPPLGKAAKDILLMVKKVSENEENLRKRPIISGGVQFTSPLQIWPEASEVLIEFAKNNIPLSIGSIPMAGATSPITLAGTLVQQNAEILAGFVLAQSITPGIPLIYNGVGTIMDMKTANLSMGSPEQALLSAAVAQISRFYNIPSLVNCCLSESKIYDVQVGYEKATSAVLSALAGANLLMGAGMLQYCEISCPKALIMDEEITGYALRSIQSIKVTEDTLATEIIEQVGPGGNFLAQKHSRDFLQDEQYITKITDRRRKDVWIKNGMKNIESRAKEKAIQILNEHHPPPLDKNLQKELRKIVKNSEK